MRRAGAIRRRLRNGMLGEGPPGLEITGPAEPWLQAETVTFTFSEDVTGFVVGDITVVNGAASAFAGSGAVYTATITPAAAGTVTVSVAADVCVDAAGNANLASNTLSFSAILPVFWVDASDSTTLFQDAVFTIPATQDTDPVGGWMDKRGNGYHATAAGAARP